MIYLDFQKAFDKVPHLPLLSKVKAYGILGSVFNWIENFYLICRKQRVAVHGYYSNWTEVISGVLQGRVLRLKNVNFYYPVYPIIVIAWT